MEKKREIKFRAWDKNKKEYHYFGFNDMCGYEELEMVEMCEGQNISGVYLRDGFHFSTNTNDRNGELCPFMDIQQFTGLLDKNGKEIYEGDIVRATFSDSCFPNKEQSMDIVVKYGENGLHNCPQVSEYLWVIGNIYENPELLSNIKEE